MGSTNDTKLGGLPSKCSRRNLLKGATTTTLTAAASVQEVFGKPRTSVPFGMDWLYIGTHTGALGPAEEAAGIY